MTAAPTSARDKLKARIAALKTPNLIEYYGLIARKLEAAPSGPGASEYIIILGMMDCETLDRNIPCCPQCSVPDAAKFHATSLHDTGSPADQVADALTDAAMTAYAVAVTDAAQAAADATPARCPVCVYGEPTDHTCDEGQQHRYRVETAGRL